jgi:hypothetical protein
LLRLNLDTSSDFILASFLWWLLSGEFSLDCKQTKTIPSEAVQWQSYERLLI